MEKELFDRETILDLTVNFIPLVILAIFIVLYVVVTPFGFDSVISSIQLAIIGAMFVALAALTYYSGGAISRAEKQAEAAANELESTEDADSALDADDDATDEA